MMIARRVLGRKLKAAAPLVFLALLALYAAWPWLPLARGAPPGTIVLYGFSILGEVMNEGIFPAFQAEWAATSSERVELVSAFAGSGTITNQVIMGVPAELALLSLELDADRLAAAGVVRPKAWHRLPGRGVVNRTPFVVLTRAGNPLGIRDFADLAREGVRVVHPDPLTSGGAKWAILAEYGAGQRANPSDPDAGRLLLLGIWRNVVAQAASARAARTQFEQGFGDALVTYEQEVLHDRRRGRLEGEVVYPRATILSEHTLVVVDRNIAPRQRQLIDAFVAFLWSERAQRIFVDHGFRGVLDELNDERDRGAGAGGQGFGHIPEPFTVADFGGWEAANRDVVEGVWKLKVLPEAQK